MSKFKDGGLAFPGTRFEPVGTEADYGGSEDDLVYGDVPHPGMSLRDYVAAKTLAAMVAGMWSNSAMGGVPPQDMCEGAFDYADAFLKAREASQ